MAIHPFIVHNLFRDKKTQSHLKKATNTGQTCSQMIEIERKFWLKPFLQNRGFYQNHIAQGYLSSLAERTVRVRIKANKGYLTIKGMTNETGMSRFEWEKRNSSWRS
jgi:hypothetical protein